MSKKLSSFPLTYKGTTYMNMVEVPAGSFVMENENKKNDSIEITFKKPFFMAEFPVTQELYEAVMGSNPSYFKGKRKPVEQVYWLDVYIFLEKINKETKVKYRIPRDVEWEYASRDGNRSQDFKFSGSENLDIVGWYKGNSNQETKPVGLKMPNSLGIYDMSGNVWEWCEDWFSDKNSHRIIRGGSWLEHSAYCPIVLRDIQTPENSNNNIGFRLCSFLR